MEENDFDFDAIIKTDLCDRILSEMVKDDPDHRLIDRLWFDLDELVQVDSPSG